MMSDLAKVWEQRLQAWKASGKTLKDWSKENGFKYTTSYSWKERLLGTKKKKPSQQKPIGFYELGDEPKNTPGIIIEVNGIQLHIEQQFDSKTLLQCLKVIKEGLC